MNRHEFLKILPALSVGSQLPYTSADDLQTIAIPPFLTSGDTIALTSPAGYITLEEIQPAKLLMESWGFKILVGNTIGKRDFTFGGTDAERLADLQSMLDNRNVRAIMCARGGYGVNRILDQLNLSQFIKYPKWVIGFSDITALHLHLLKHAKVASIHSKMCNSFPKEWSAAEPIVQETILSIKQGLNGSVLSYASLPDMYNRRGKAEGVITGGNLAIIISMMGTASEIETDGRILFLEEVGEYLYSIDRMMTTLHRAGKLAKLRGLVVCGFNRIKTDDPGEEFGRSFQEIILSKVKDYSYPVCFGFPVGHQKDNFAIRHGMVHQLVVDEKGAVLISH
jgi:muramoyltetrapeptide carboxypeptidase